jgi:5-methylcytosine-specific restriction endonuclease McrA
MNNPRITKKEHGLLKGALRRVFSRSELRNSVVKASLVEHLDPNRPRVKKWCLCNICRKPEAKSYVVVDHINPVIPVHTSFEAMSLDEVVDRLWCAINNLQVVCSSCHDEKTKQERKDRKAKRTK